MLNNPISENKNCCCSKKQELTEPKSLPKPKIALKELPSIFLSVIIAFFPKCPVCWAVYMSMFGCLGLDKLPYMGWLYPVLLVFLGIHLYRLYKKSDTNGFLPFQLGLLGAIIMLIGRFTFQSESWLILLGMGLIVSSSLLASFSSIWLHYFRYKSNSN